jgi:uncharacterized 2Fe-2S/4Fe-4S cluster protein (DUF4445 family)
MERECLSEEQLDAGLRLACQVVPTSGLRVILDKLFVPERWRPLRDDEYCPVSKSAPPRMTAARYGVAVDIGTTHIRLSLWDLKTQTRLDGRSGLNPQIIHGADVLTRLMHAARSPQAAQEISALAQKAIGQALAEMAAASGINTAGVDEVWLVGNTAMMSLLSGRNYVLLLQPEYWTQRVNCQPQDVGFLREAWGLPVTAAINFVPPLGGFVGSDLLAGIIATRLTEQAPGSLLIDFGTNSEIALWDGHVLRVTSAAGGPAFEGGGISCGMPGEMGAIYRVRAKPDQTCEFEVLGGGEPLGICGSGLVDSIAWMRRNGRLDKIGRFTTDEAGLQLHEQIVLHKRDIDVLQRAKAAIGAGVLWLCGQAGMQLADISRVYACGAFGQLLDVANAQSIGLLPTVQVDAVELQGNTALAGCELLMLSATASQILQGLLATAQIHNMAEEVAYESLFVECLYLQPMQA